MKSSLFTPFFACLLVLALAPKVQAAVKMPGIFGDHMVLQQGLTLPVWGTADPGETVKVSVGDHQGDATADAKGDWMVKLDPLPANSQPVDVQINGSNALVYHDVLVGDVWVCSGQSNMAFGLGTAHNASVAIPQADHPLIRLYLVGQSFVVTPQADCKGQWFVCTPENIIHKIGGWNGFSAVAYFFACEIQQDQKVPIGLIGSYRGGTPAQSWSDLETLQADPILAHYADALTKTRDSFDQLKQDYESQILPPWQTLHDTWQVQYGAAYADALKQWQDQANVATKAGQTPPPWPHPAQPEPAKPLFVGEDPHQPTMLFNGMINPITRYGIKGVIWYQGEENALTEASSREYATLFPALISGWRRQWAQTNSSLAQFPFLFVQLASFGGIKTIPYLRAAQAKALALPNTGMAVAIDVGEEKDIHPKDKIDVGHRLALVARHVAYGEDLICDGPIYDSMKQEDSKIRLSFRGPSHAATTGTGDLVIGVAPAIRLDVPVATPAADLQGFVIAGTDGKFQPAQASIDGETVVVWSDSVPVPTAVRYDWDAYPKPPGNLYNKEGLPTAPFATDITL